MPAKMEIESEPKVTCTSNMGQGFLAQGQLGNSKGDEKYVGPNELAQLMLEYSSTETCIILILSLGELTADLIGEDRSRSLFHYHLPVEATMDNICTVVTAQQLFVQQAADLIMERKAHFIVDPRDTLIPILQDATSPPQLYVA